MEHLLKSAVQNGILMTVAISVTYLTVLHWHLHIGLVIVAMAFVGLITALLYKWALESLFPSPKNGKRPPAFATVAHFAILFVVLTAQYFIIRKRFNFQERMYILVATAFSTDFFKMILLPSK